MRKLKAEELEKLKEAARIDRERKRREKEEELLKTKLERENVGRIGQLSSYTLWFVTGLADLMFFLVCAWQIKKIPFRKILLLTLSIMKWRLVAICIFGVGQVFGFVDEATKAGRKETPCRIHQGMEQTQRRPGLWWPSGIFTTIWNRLNRFGNLTIVLDAKSINKYKWGFEIVQAWFRLNPQFLRCQKSAF